MRSPLPFDPVAEARRLWRDHGWADAADGMAAVTSVMRAQQIMLARVEVVLRPLEISFSRYEVLVLLHFSRCGELPMSIIGERLQVHPTSVTNSVDRLERVGLVLRRTHPKDRRAVLVVITEAGSALVLEATETLNTRVFCETGLSKRESTQLFDVLATLRKGSGDF